MKITKKRTWYNSIANIGPKKELRTWQIWCRLSEFLLWSEKGEKHLWSFQFRFLEQAHHVLFKGFPLGLHRVQAFVEGKLGPWREFGVQLTVKLRQLWNIVSFYWIVYKFTIPFHCVICFIFFLPWIPGHRIPFRPFPRRSVGRCLGTTEYREWRRSQPWNNSGLVTNSISFCAF